MTRPLTPILRSLIVLLLATGAAFGQRMHDFEARLQADYVGKSWVIRGFYEGPELTFDAGGKLLKGEPPISWAVSGVEVTALQLHQTSVEIRGNRFGYIYDASNAKSNHQYRVLRTKQKVEAETVRIAVQTLGSEDEAGLRQSLEAVLTAEDRDLSREVPDYWRAFLEKLAGTPEKPPELGSSLRFHAAGSGPVYRVGKDVTAPRPILTPDPKYAEPARIAKFQGVTVLLITIDKAGRPAEVNIVRPTGFGLDGKAVEAVRDWEFEPAQRNGEPVAVMTNVQVSFRLY